MSNMDFDYWNLNPLVLDKGEEVKQELLKYYELGYMNSMIRISISMSMVLI